MFMDNLLPVYPVCTKPDLSRLRSERFRARDLEGVKISPPSPQTTDTCPLPTPTDSPYHKCRSGPCHIAGPNQDQPLRPVTCRDQPPLQPRILQPSLACCRRPKMGRNGTEWYRMVQNGTEIEISGPSSRRSSPESSNPPSPVADATKWNEMVRNGTEIEKSGLSSRRLQAMPIIAAAPTLARAARSSGIGEGTPHRWLQDHRFRHELTRLRQEAADLARYELQGLMPRCLDMSTTYHTDRNDEWGAWHRTVLRCGWRRASSVV